MRKTATAVLIVLIKNMNARYLIHLRSASANGSPGLVLQGSHGWQGDVPEGVSRVSLAVSFKLEGRGGGVWSRLCLSSMPRKDRSCSVQVNFPQE